MGKCQEEEIKSREADTRKGRIQIKEIIKQVKETQVIMPKVIIHNSGVL